MTDGIKTLHYSDLFLAMYFEEGEAARTGIIRTCWYICTPVKWLSMKEAKSLGCIKETVPLSVRTLVCK